MNMLRIDPADPAAPFEQLKRQLVEQITTGQLPPGTKLPPVRRLAADLGLAAGTVARAYRELEADAYLVTMGRGGTLVAPAADTTTPPENVATGLTSGYVREMRRLGFDNDDIIGEVRRVLG